jgi:hypothetical protein
MKIHIVNILPKNLHLQIEQNAGLNNLKNLLIKEMDGYQILKNVKLDKIVAKWVSDIYIECSFLHICMYFSTTF